MKAGIITGGAYFLLYSHRLVDVHRWHVCYHCNRQVIMKFKLNGCILCIVASVYYILPSQNLEVCFHPRPGEMFEEQRNLQFSCSPLGYDFNSPLISDGP